MNFIRNEDPHPTDKQLQLIARMKRIVNLPEFTGRTVLEASEFISTHLYLYQAQREIILRTPHYPFPLR